MPAASSSRRRGHEHVGSRLLRSPSGGTGSGEGAVLRNAVRGGDGLRGRPPRPRGRRGTAALVQRGGARVGAVVPTAADTLVECIGGTGDRRSDRIRRATEAHDGGA